MPARTHIRALTDIPNIGPSIAGDLHRIGITRPAQLKGKNGLTLYRRICRRDGHPHDPCLIDCLLAATDYMSGAPARPWWKYTPKRKRLLA
jgi:hypothetical protein